MTSEDDKVVVAVYHPEVFVATSHSCVRAHKIRQIVTCSRRDMDKQHIGFEGHTWADITGQHDKPHPSIHALHPDTKQLISRVADLTELKAAKETELFHACRAAISDALMDDTVEDFQAHRASCMARRKALLAALSVAATPAQIAAVAWPVCAS